MPLEIKIDNPELNEPATELDGEGSLGGVHNSPEYTSSETSEHRDDYVHVDLPYPSEIPDDIHPSDSASESRPRSHRRHTTTSSRAHTRSTRPPPPRQDLEPAGYRHRDQPPDSPESVDSAEDYVGGPPYRPNPPPRQVYYGGPLPYAPSHSSAASYAYPPVPGPPSNQMVHYGAAASAPYAPHYSQMGVPPPAGYPPPAQPYPMSHHSGSHVGSAPFGVPPPFAGPQMMPYPPAPGYFPPQYPAVFPQPSPWDPYQRFRQSPAPPPPGPGPGPAPAPAPAPAPPEPAPQQRASPTHSTVSNNVDQEEIVKRVEAMLLEEKKEREAREAAREAALQKANDEAAAKLERAASDARIAEEAAARAREEVKKEVEAKAAADAAKAKAEAEAAARAREEVKKEVEAKAAADAAKAKADAEAAARAREEVKKEVEAKAAADAAKAKAEADAKAERAASDARIAEEAVANAKRELEEAAAAAAAAAKEKKELEKAAAAAAAAAAPPPAPAKKPPIRFKDAVGRKFNFPFHLCAKWSGMEELIRQAFLHVENIGPHVQDGHYDLLGPNGEIILPQVWETVVEPDWTVTMHMWPLPPEPEKPKTPPPPPPPPEGEILTLDELLGPGKKVKGKGAKKSIPPPAPPPPPPVPSLDALNPTAPLDAPAAGLKEVDKSSKKAGPAKTGPKKVVPASSFSAWMMGGKAAKPPAKALKETKKPDGAAGSQNGAPANEGSCTVM